MVASPVTFDIRVNTDPLTVALNRAVRQMAQAEARIRMTRAEFVARTVVKQSLRPRLRWMGLRPRGLRLLRLLGLWTPPSIAWRGGHVAGVYRKR